MHQRPYLQPVARVMRLYRHHSGTHAIRVGRTPEGLDVTASRPGDTVYLHVANTLRTKSGGATIQIEGQTAQQGASSRSQTIP